MNLGELVRARRESLNCSQPQLAEKIHKTAKDHRLNLKGSNGNDIEINNVWISRLEKNTFKRPLPASTLRAVCIALEDTPNASLYETLNRQLNTQNYAGAVGEGLLWPLYERLPDDLKDLVQPSVAQYFPNSMTITNYLTYISDRLNRTKSSRALMCVYMNASAAGADHTPLARQMSELVRGGLTIAYCSVFPRRIDNAKDEWDTALGLETLRIRQSHTNAISQYSMAAHQDDSTQKNKPGDVLFMELTQGQMTCPPAVIESRDVLVIFDEGPLEARSRYLWAEVVNCNARFVPNDEAELHALILYAAPNEMRTDESTLWSLVEARVGLFKEIIEHWESSEPWPEEGEVVAKRGRGTWKRSKF